MPTAGARSALRTRRWEHTSTIADLSTSVGASTLPNAAARSSIVWLAVCSSCAAARTQPITASAIAAPLLSAGSSSVIERRCSSALIEPRSNARCASSSRTAGESEPGRKMLSVGSGTRCSSSTRPLEMSLAPSTSPLSSGIDGHSYLTESPHGPTITIRRSHRMTSESAPHQTSWRGRRVECALNSERVRAKSAE